MKHEGHCQLTMLECNGSLAVGMATHAVGEASLAGGF